MSAAVKPRVGEVIPFWYLWWREHERGEDAGRKLRPCIVIAVHDASGAMPEVAVLPITHSPPTDDRSAVEMPMKVKAHLGLDVARSWVMCDEQNEFRWPGYDLGKTPDGRGSYGGVPDAFVAKLVEAHREARKRGALKSASRDE